MKKVTIIFAVALLLQLPVAAQIRITHGPWLTDMSEDGVTIMWKTDKPAMAWVEYDEYVGNTFYSKYHPVAYDSKDGRRRVLDTLHCVRLEGLKNSEIATNMGLSEKTVEAYITKSLKQIRIFAKKNLILLIFLGL